MTDTTTPLATDDDMKAIAAIIKDAKVAFLTTMSEHGHHHSRPLAVQNADFTGDLWFFTQDPSDKASDIRRNPQVNAAFQSGKGFLSVAGVAEIVHDRARVDELWNPAVEAWFPEGKDDTTIALIRVRPESAEYWYSTEPGVISAFKVVKAMVTGDQPDVGENRAVEL
ncbi:pyridoxamine 5'-phosphate oxidase family protein [Homoserinimonas hongtaonis]|uniref:General stress protein n=1 Tax=Homoserinimonas hongtaonis TaxID=2079791 RepID=A0A2U1SY29_9MICO|nr:pyridoxamine 5'-phosphate oxidase family protein [Salinibacterium hongtaonis]AWB89086.1 general stress protein [Salinibacterium hongtaonis]PWB96535.1 general stress protein [Salinibacterium hongtaonis]